MVCTNNPSLFTRLDILPRKKIVWLLDRSIKLSKFRMRGAVPEDIALKYLQEFGRCIQSVSISLVINCEFIKAIATHCPNVTEVDVETTDGALLDILREFPRAETLTVICTTGSANKQTGCIVEPLTFRKLQIGCFHDSASEIDIASLL